MCGLNSEEDLVQTLVILSFPYHHQTHQFLDILLKIGRIGKVWTIERQVEHTGKTGMGCPCLGSQIGITSG